MKTVKIMRGIPGSGKSTTTHRLAKEYRDSGYNVEICSSDDFFTCTKCGHYDWDVSILGPAHKWCQAKFAKALLNEVHVVFVDNTNVTVRECKPYVEMALTRGYDIEFIEPKTPWAFNVDELVKRNQHGVPREGIERMLRRWVPDMTIAKAMGEVAVGEQTVDEKAAAFAAQV